MENGGFQNDIRRDANCGGARSMQESSTGCISPVAPTPDIENDHSSAVDHSTPCSCAPCNERQSNNPEVLLRPSRNIQSVSWTTSKCKAFTVTILCLIIWAAVYFTLASYGYIRTNMELTPKTDPGQEKNDYDVLKESESEYRKTDSATSGQRPRLTMAIHPDEVGTEKSERDSRDLATRETTSQLTSKYSTFCSCGDSRCTCSHHLTLWERTLPRNALYWPKLKVIIMVCLASIPWLFFLVYIIVYFL